jgi:O-antigen ligase
LVGGAVAADVTGTVRLDKLRRIGDTLAIWTGGGEINRFDLHRQAMAQGAQEVIRDHLVLGTGLGRENYLNALRHTTVHVGKGRLGYAVAHNLYLTYFAQLGLVGFLMLLLFFAVVGLELWRAHRLVEHPSTRTLLSAGIAGHVAILVMFSGNEYIIAPFPWWFWGLALGMGYGAIKAQAGRARPVHASTHSKPPQALAGRRAESPGWSQP